MERASYNVLDRPWIVALMKDGTVRKIGILEAFEKSRMIKALIPPVFHEISCSIYMPTVYKLLAVLWQAANDIQSKEGSGDMSYIDDYWDDPSLLNEEVRDYLDLYYECFDIFSNETPFLQNIRIAESEKYKPEEEDSKFISVLNPSCPSKSAEMFGIKRSYGVEGTKAEYYEEAWRPTPEEFVYELLYNSSDAASVMPAQFTSSLAAKSTIYPVLIGEDLHETVLLNCVPLNDTESRDAPIWECESSPDVYDLFDPNAIKDQLLFNAFFPCKPLLASPYLNEEGKIRNVCTPTVLNKKSDITTESLYGYTKEDLTALQNAYVPSNPWPVRCIKVEKTKKKDGKGKKEKQPDKAEQTEKAPEEEKKTSLIYKPYYPESESAWGLCIAATGRPEGFDVVSLFQGKERKPFHTSIFYRILGGKYRNIINGFGEIHIDTDIRVLLDQDSHKMAEEFQNVYDRVRSVLNSAMNIADYNDYEKEIARGQFAAFVEHFFFNRFIKMLEDDSENAMEETKEAFRNAVLDIYRENTDFRTNNWEKNAKGENDIIKSLFRKKAAPKNTTGDTK